MSLVCFHFVIDTLKVSPSGIDQFPFLEKDKFIHFHFDNSGFNVDTVDGKNQLHGGLIVLFQNGESSGEVKIPSIDLTSKTFKVMRNEFTELQNCNVSNTKQFNIDNDFLYDHPPPTVSLCTTNAMLPWMMLKSTSVTSSETPPWSGYFSSIGVEPKMQTNIAALPIIPHPVTEWNTINTALKIMCNLNRDVSGEGYVTTVSLDLAIYEKAVQLVYCTNNSFSDRFNFRLGELHVSMAQLRGIGSYIEGYGLDSICQSDVYGPAVTKSILACTHYKRTFDAPEITVVALHHLFVTKLFKENPEIENNL